MKCYDCDHCEKNVCKIYNLPVDQFDVMDYCAHKKKKTEKQYSEMWPSKPISQIVRLT